MDKQDQEKARARDYADDRHSERYSGGAVTKRDVIQCDRAALRDDVIIDRIDRSVARIFHLSRDDEQDLRDAGVSEMVVQEMRATARR